MDEPLTRKEKRRVGVNVLIRLGAVGFSAWWLVDHAGRVPPWGLVIYAFTDLVVLLGPLSLFALWVYQRHGPGEQISN